MPDPRPAPRPGVQEDLPESVLNPPRAPVRRPRSKGLRGDVVVRKRRSSVARSRLGRREPLRVSLAQWGGRGETAEDGQTLKTQKQTPDTYTGMWSTSRKAHPGRDQDGIQRTETEAGRQTRGQGPLRLGVHGALQYPRRGPTCNGACNLKKKITSVQEFKVGRFF